MQEAKIAVSIALFCAGGGLVRYFLSWSVYSMFGRSFPYGTFVVNVIGAYLIGLIMGLGLRGSFASDALRLGLTVGFLGGLTTFSTFSYETYALLEDGRIVSAAANIIISVFVCLLFTWLGIVTARALA